MPIVRIDIQSGKTTEYKRALLRGVREAITEELGAPDDRVMQRIVETAREDVDTTDERSDRLTIVEISMLPRAVELKEKLYQGIARRLTLEPGVSKRDLVVLVNDPAAECFFIDGSVQCATPAPAEQPASDEPAAPEPDGPEEPLVAEEEAASESLAGEEPES
jgi:phenylpyruvate tautomerase PptA (4-oxalocrotonate tautomerase family)